MNSVTLIGNLGSDPEVSEYENFTIARFRMATSESYKDKSGKKVTKTQWHSIELWNGLARVAGTYLKKGNKVCIQGKIEYDKYEKDGAEVVSTKIKAEKMEMLSSFGDTNTNNNNNNISKGTQPVY